MANLLQETIEMLKANNKSTKDVLFVTDGVNCCSLATFASQANKEYKDWCGWVVVNECLQVVGKGWWLERQEYDGSEWWEFKSLPEKPSGVGEVKVWEED